MTPAQVRRQLEGKSYDAARDELDHGRVPGPIHSLTIISRWPYWREGFTSVECDWGGRHVMVPVRGTEAEVNEKLAHEAAHYRWRMDDQYRQQWELEGPR